MTEWKWAIGDLAAPTRELATARGRRLTVRVDAACDAQFTLDGDGDEIREVAELATDLYVWRDATLVFRGRVCGWQGSLDGDTHAVTFSAVDYRGMLNRRFVGAAGAYFPPGTDQATIPWSLISASQAQAGGDWGITNGAGSSSSTPHELTLAPGKPLGDAIGELGRGDDGFEWEISPTLVLNRWFPRRGVDSGLALDYGGLIKAVRYGFDPGDFGNVDMVTGDAPTVPVTVTAATVATDPRGRWEVARSYSGVVLQDTLTARAAWLAEQTSQVRPDYRVTFAAGRWDGPTSLWVGDIAYPSFKRGWLTEDGTTPHRAVEVQIVLDDDGGEDVQMGLLAVVP